MLKIGSTKSERYLVLGNLAKGILPTSWDDSVSEKATLLRKLTSRDPSSRPFAKEILKGLKLENLDGMLFTCFLKFIYFCFDILAFDMMHSVCITHVPLTMAPI